MDYSKLPASWLRLVIDGDPGAGKTTHGKEMAQILRARQISFDDYLPGNRENYLEQLNYRKLRKAILANEDKVIMDGVCALAVLARIEIKHDYHIFIKGLNGFVGWEFEYYLNPNTKMPRSKLTCEVIKYYRDYKPFEKCDYELERDILEGFMPS